eukprot:gene7749-biopygen16579
MVHSLRRRLPARRRWRRRSPGATGPGAVPLRANKKVRWKDESRLFRVEVQGTGRFWVARTDYHRVRGK